MSGTAGTVNLPSEDVGAIVVDIGSFETRAGFAGEDTPKAVFPSVVGVSASSSSASSHIGSRPDSIGDISSSDERKKWRVGHADVVYRRDDCAMRPCYDQEGVPSDLSVVECLVEHAVASRMKARGEEHPLMLVEPSWNTQQVREQWTELALEKMKAPGMFVAKSAVLATFMNAKATGLVLDCGHGWASAVPVLEGYALKKCIQRSQMAGERIQVELLDWLEKESHGVPIHPQYACHRRLDASGALTVDILDFPKTHPSFRRYMIMDVIRDMKENVCRVSETDYSDALYEKFPPTPYQLPDGRVVQVGVERFKSTEILFKPDFRNPILEPLPDKVKGASELVYGAIQLCDADLRKDMWNNLCLAGGTTLMPGFKERLERDLTNIAPNRIRLTASTFPVERKFSSWIGGSILASLGSFQQMWISKAEYNEHGPSIVGRKCP